MEYLSELLLFAGKTLVIVASIMVVLGFIASMAMKGRQEGHLKIENLNKKYQSFAKSLKSFILSKKDLKHFLKKEKKSLKDQKKKTSIKKKIYVLEFKGDIKASSVESLGEEVTAILTAANRGDEVVLCLESPGGVVHGYGLAAAQLLRIKEHGITLTVCVDKVAASGGYMMACVADKVCAAPFAILGSVGVLAQVPNFHRFLKKHDVDYKEVTAGEFKRTVSLFGEITPEGEKKFREQIEDTHALFKEFVKNNRPQVEVEKIATGEYWFAARAKDLALVDELVTSQEYLFQKRNEADIYKVQLIHKKKVLEKVSEAIQKGVSQSFEKFWSRTL
ncbi:MAG: protease SohB [Bdellovibrio sp.]|nr:MAG: protease SohB [Bdellovibrio sp.]